MMLHHITMEVEKDRLSDELTFWGLLGFAPTGVRREGRGQPIVHWLVNGLADFAVELIPMETVNLDETSINHLCMVRDDYNRTLDNFDRFHVEYEETTRYWGYKRAFLHSPSGYVVELLSGRPPIKAGPPIQEQESV